MLPLYANAGNPELYISSNDLTRKHHAMLESGHNLKIYCTKKSNTEHEAEYKPVLIQTELHTKQWKFSHDKVKSINGDTSF